MRICREYEFPQDKTSVSHAVEEGINTLLRLNCSEDCIVDLYLVALLSSYTVLTLEQKEWLAEQSPLLFRRTRVSKDQRQIPHAKCNEEIAKVQESWQMIEPLSFLEQYQAYLYHKKNDSGLENGMISTRLLFDVKDNMKLLIVDPSPSFLRHLEQEEKIKQLKITVAFTNNRYALVNSCHVWPSHIVCTKLENVDFTIPYAKICIMGAGMDYNVMERLLRMLCETETIHEKTIVFLLAPLAFIDRRGKDDLVRQTINRKCTVLQIVQIDPKAVNITPSKRCMIVLKCKRYEEREYIPMQKAVLIEENGQKAIKCGDIIRVKYSDFLRGNKTINALIATANNNIKRRNPPEQFVFSPEIVIWGSVREVHNEKNNTTVYHPTFRFYDYPSPSQMLKNKLERGQCVVEGVYGGTVYTREAVYDRIDELLFTSTELSGKIRRVVDTNYSGKPVSLKTYWYWKYPELAMRSDYKDKLCKEIFLSRNWSENPLSSLVVGASDTDSIANAMEQFAKRYKLSNKKYEIICEQLLIIWNLYLQDNRTMQNPVSDIFAEIADRRDAEYDMRNALALRSLTVKQMRLLLEYLKNDCTDPIMALLVKCKLFLGLGSGAIAALTIGDYYKIPGYDLQVLSVTQALPQTGTQPQPFVRPWQNVLVPVTTGIAKELDDLVSATKNELLLSGVPEKNFGEYPLFHSSNLKEPIRTRRINEYCAELLSKLEIPEIVLNNPDDGIESDIGQYNRDLLVSNWKMQAARIAEMDRAAISYLSGTRQKTVTNNNYRDFSHPLQLKKLKVNLEKLQTKIEQALPLPDKKCIHMSLRDNMRKTVMYAPQATATEIVIELQMKESDRVELELDALHGCIMSIEYLEEK